MTWQQEAWEHYQGMGVLWIPAEPIPEPGWWQLRRRVRLWRSHRRFMRDLRDALSKPVDPSTPTR